MLPNVDNGVYCRNQNNFINLEFNPKVQFFLLQSLNNKIYRIISEIKIRGILCERYRKKLFVGLYKKQNTPPFK